MELKTEKNMLRLSYPYDKSKIKLCKKLGMRWSKQKKDWYFANNFMNRLCLDRIFPGICPQSPKKIKELIVPEFLMEHQKGALRRAARQDRRGIYHDTGTGKTLATLEIIKHHNVKTLVMCPLSLIEGAWIPETQKWYPAINASNLWLAKKRSYTHLAKKLEKDLCIINYESFRTINKVLAKANFEMVILDESARIRSQKSSTAKKVIEFCDNVQYVYELSGVPAPNSMLDYWTQIRILDPLLWGKSFYKFRTKYFYPTGYGGYKWEVKPEYKEKLMEDIKTVAEYVNKADVLDLPERTDSMRVFQLSAEERKHYKNIKNELVTILDDGEVITSPSAVTALMKLRQIPSGFILDKILISGETDKKGRQKFKTIAHNIGNSKINEFRTLVEDIGPKQVIVWINFKHEALQVVKALREMGVESGLLNSTATEKQKQEYLKAFKSGDLQYIVCHPKSVGFGHTLVNCTEAIYYSWDHSYDNSHQSRDRMYRKGQTKKCTYYYLLSDNTMDLPILKAVKSKENVSQAVLDYLKK